MSETGTRAANVAALEAVLGAVNAGDGATARLYLAEHVRYEAPWYDLDVQGRGRLVEMFDGLGTRFASIDYRVTELIPALDPDLVIVEARGDHAVRDSTKRYQNHYVLFVTFADGLVVRWVEYSNPEVFREAMA